MDEAEPRHDRTAAAHAALDALYRSDSRRMLATLIRLLGDFELAEDGLQDAMAIAARTLAAGRHP